MTRERFTVPVLVTLEDDSEELRRITVEAWSLSEAMELAKQRALEDERVIDVEAQIR